MDTELVSPIVLCLLFSAFFSGMEIAFISSNKLHIELQGKQGGFTGRIISKFAQRPPDFIATTLIGNNLALVVYGMLMAMLLKPWLTGVLPPALANDFVILAIQTIVSTLIVLVTAEFLPKSIFLINPYFLLSFFSVPFLIVYYLLSPVVYFIVRFSKFFIISILRLEYSEDKTVFGLTDLNQYIKNVVANEEEVHDQDVDTKIFHNALEFKTVKIRECMIPRTEISAVAINDPIGVLKSMFIESGHSKIIVYDDSIDDVIGYCHSLELFKKPKDVKAILTKIPIVPETMAANELLIQLISEHKSLALVVDEYGGTSGIVSIEDIIEEIFGEIRDEHDEDELIEEKIKENEFVLSARHEIDYINETYHINLPLGEYDTIGGLILAVNENLPKQSQVIDLPGFSIEILLMQEAMIEKIRLKVRPSDDASNYPNPKAI